jgi:hypothetical protein
MKGKFLLILLLQAAMMSALLILLASCSYITIGLPDKKETSAIQAGSQAIVLLRVTGIFYDSTDSSETGAFGHELERIVDFGLYYGDPQGKAEFVNPQRFLSSETKKQGWIYFIMKPTNHYLVFVRGCSLKNKTACERKLNRARLWQIVIPKDTPIVYIGSMHLGCENFSVLGNCRVLDENKMFLRSEESLARQLAEIYLSEFGSIQTVLMKPFD